MANSEDMKRCPYCGEEILAIAIKCKHCREFLGGIDPETPLGTCGVGTSPDEPETTRWTGSPSRIHYVDRYLIAAAACWCAWWLWDRGVEMPAGLLCIFGVTALVLTAIQRRVRVFTLTNRRVKAQDGYLVCRVQEVALRDIRSLELHQGEIERLFGVGTIEIGSAGTAGTEVQFTGIRDVHEVRELMSRAKDEADRQAR